MNTQLATETVEDVEPKFDEELTISPISKMNIEEVWDNAVPFLARIPEIGVRYELKDVKRWLESGELQLWVIWSPEEVVAIFCTEVVSFPKAKVLRIAYAAGTKMRRWVGFLPKLEEWAKSEGYTEIEIEGRPGWGRVTGYEETSRTWSRRL